MTIAVTILILINAGIYLYINKKNKLDAALLANKIESSVELKKTLAMGLYMRFNFPHVKSEDGNIHFEKSTDIFLKQLPYEFEDFVAYVMQKRIGGNVYITSGSGDFGVDFELDNQEGLFLGQAKAYKADVGYEPIATLHSNMIKQKATGGFLITTSSYTKAAREYASGLGIELIDGLTLVEYWLKSLDQKVYSLSNETV